MSTYTQEPACDETVTRSYFWSEDQAFLILDYEPDGVTTTFDDLKNEITFSCNNKDLHNQTVYYKQVT